MLIVIKYYWIELNERAIIKLENKKYNKWENYTCTYQCKKLTCGNFYLDLLGSICFNKWLNQITMYVETPDHYNTK